MPVQYAINMTYASIGYGILGYYLVEYKLSSKFSVAALAVGFAMVFGGTYFMSVRQGFLYEHFFEGMTVGVFLVAVGIFGMCVSVKELPKLVKSAVVYVSKVSFCIYLVHVLFINIFTNHGFTINILPCVVSIPLVALSNFAASLCVYLVLSKIPLIKKWLV